jgi:hypothetical protein
MFKLTLADISTIGSGMQRPECVLTTKSGTLFCSDSRGGYNIIRPDGQSSFVRADEGFVSLSEEGDARTFIERCRKLRFWDRQAVTKA